MQLLVAGAAPVDAGKTTFATGLIERTGADPYKPRAGNDYWHDHGDVRRATREGRLYGKDASRLVDVGDRDAEPEIINPVHRLWAPSPGPGTGLLGDEDRSFLVDRAGEQFVVNGTVALPEDLRERLALSSAPAVTSLDEFNDLMAGHHVPVIQSLADDVARSQRAVVESYGDVARPIANLAPDAVAVVEPCRVRTYDGDRYVTACEVTSGGPGTGQLEERVGAVVDLIDPTAVEDLPPLTSDDRADPARIAAAYEDAYDALLATAFDGE